MISAYETSKLPQGYYTYGGTVLLRRDTCGSSQSLLLFMRDIGMRWVSAPGATGRKNRFGGAIEPMAWAEFHLFQSVKGLYLQSAEVREDFLAVRSSPKRLLASMRCYKRVKQTLMAEHESNQILVILWNTMLAFNENCPEQIVEYRFNWRLLKALGLAPSLQSCCECGLPLGEEPRWSSNGLLCSRCGSGTANKPVRELLDIQRAAMLDHHRFVQWAKKQTYNDNMNFFGEYIKKLIIFFTNFS